MTKRGEYFNKQQNRQDGFQEIAEEAEKTSWTAHLKNAKQQLESLMKKGNKNTGNSENFFRLSQYFETSPTISEKAKGNGYLKNLYASWDEGIKMPRELGEMIQQVVEDPDYQFGIHRSNKIQGANYKTDPTLHSILEDGLLILGDDSSGVTYKDPWVSKSVSFCPRMLNAVILTKSSYKGSTGAVLIKIPSKYVDEDGKIKEGMVDKVYNHNQSGSSLLKPEFIMGFVQNLGEDTTLKYTSREDLLENYRRE